LFEDTKFSNGRWKGLTGSALVVTKYHMGKAIIRFAQQTSWVSDL